MLLMILINYLTSSPFPAQDLHLCGAELVVACKFRLYDQQGLCPSCGKASNILLGEHSLVCGMGGERIVRHNAVRDAFHCNALLLLLVI